jgi:MFS family permease
VTSGRSLRRLSLGLVITVVLLAFDALAVATIGPRVAHDLHGDDLYGWLFSAFMLTNLVGIVISGHVSDRQGPAAVYTLGFMIFGGGLVLAGLAPTMEVLVLARAVQGFGAGALYNSAYVAIGRAFSETQRPRQFALLSSAWVVPGLIAPALGGAIAEVIGWRFVFVGLIVLVPVAATLALPPMRALGRGEADDAAPPIAAALLLAGGAALLVAALGAHDLVVTLPLGLAGLILAVVEFRRLTPAGTLLARRGLPAAVAFRGITTFAFFGTDAFLAFALARLHRFDPIAVGLLLTPPTFTWVGGSWIQVRVAGRWSRRRLATVGVALVAVGVAGTSVVVAHDAPLAVVAIAFAVAGLGMGLSYSPTALVALSEAEPGRQGAASSAVLLSDTLGAALGAGIGGAIVAAAPSIGWSRHDALALVFAIMTVVALFGIAVAQRFPPDPPNLDSAVHLTSADGETS